MNYFDNPNCVGWTYLGDEEHPTPLAVLINNAHSTAKRMFVGKKWAGKTLQIISEIKLLLSLSTKKVTAVSSCAKSVSAYIPQDQ